MTENSGGLMTATLGHEMHRRRRRRAWLRRPWGRAVDTEVRVIDVRRGRRELPHDGGPSASCGSARPAVRRLLEPRRRPPPRRCATAGSAPATSASIDADGYVYDRPSGAPTSSSAAARTSTPARSRTASARSPAWPTCAVVGVDARALGADGGRRRRPCGGRRRHRRRRGRALPRAAGRLQEAHRVVFLDALPRTASQKVSRASVRDMVRAMTRRADDRLSRYSSPGRVTTTPASSPFSRVSRQRRKNAGRRPVAAGGDARPAVVDAALRVEVARGARLLERPPRLVHPRDLELPGRLGGGDALDRRPVLVQRPPHQVASRGRPAPAACAARWWWSRPGSAR